MDLLTFADNKPNISPYALSVKQFKAIWDRDKSKTKDIAIQELSYVYFKCDIKSPYYGYDITIRGDKINGSLNNKVTEDKVIKEAISSYEELSKTVELRALDSVMIGLNKLLKYFEDVDLTLMNRNGTPVYSSQQLTSNIKSFGGMLKEIKKLREEIEKDSEIRGRVRGGGVIGNREIPARRN